MYEILLKRLSVPTDDYYEILTQHREDIIRATKKFGQVKVAKDLGMSQAKLSSILKILEALDNISYDNYTLYYAVFDNFCKIGVTKNPRQRLAVFKQANSFETWLVKEDVAKELEAYIKAKYIEESFKVKYNIREFVKYEIPYETYAMARNTPKELFCGDVLTELDRLHITATRRAK